MFIFTRSGMEAVSYDKIVSFKLQRQFITSEKHEHYLGAEDVNERSYEIEFLGTTPTTIPTNQILVRFMEKVIEFEEKNKEIGGNENEQR